MLLEQANSLLKKFNSLPVKEKWNVPFPMAVFGTLRKGYCNSPLMGKGISCTKDAVPSANVSRHRGEYKYSFLSHHKAFLPHFSPSGLGIYHSPNATGVFEIYNYDKENWNKMIPGVDRLESFSPTDKYEQFGYYRTLAYLRLLPDDFKSEYFADENDDYVDLFGKKGRDLKISSDLWDTFPKVPCWIYSSQKQNKLSKELKDTPIIWNNDK